MYFVSKILNIIENGLKKEKKTYAAISLDNIIHENEYKKLNFCCIITTITVYAQSNLGLKKLWCGIHLCWLNEMSNIIPKLIFFFYGR